MQETYNKKGGVLPPLWIVFFIPPHQRKLSLQRISDRCIRIIRFTLKKVPCRKESKCEIDLCKTLSPYSFASHYFRPLR